MTVLLGLVAIGAIAALVIYVVKEATVLKTTASALQEELRHFKEGGFRQLVQGELAAITARAKEELSSREKLIEAGRVQLLEQQRRATDAVSRRPRSAGSSTNTPRGGLRRWTPRASASRSSIATIAS